MIKNFLFTLPLTPKTTLFPYTTLFRSDMDKNPPSGGIFHVAGFTAGTLRVLDIWESQQAFEKFQKDRLTAAVQKAGISDRKSTRLNSSHSSISYAVFCLKKKIEGVQRFANVGEMCDALREEWGEYEEVPLI